MLQLTSRYVAFRAQIALKVSLSVNIFDMIPESVFSFGFVSANLTLKDFENFRNF